MSQDIVDTSGGLDGDTFAGARVRRCLPMSPSIPVSVSRSRSGPTTPRAARSRHPTRRGYVGQLVEHVSALGVEAITGKPYKPTTQGRNERFHQSLFRYLDEQPLAASLAGLQAQVAKAEAPRPKPEPPFFVKAATNASRPPPRLRICPPAPPSGS